MRTNFENDHRCIDKLFFGTIKWFQNNYNSNLIENIILKADEIISRWNKYFWKFVCSSKINDPNN